MTHKNNDDQVTKTIGKDPSQKPQNETIEDGVSGLGLLRELLKTPFISSVENILYRSRYEGRSSKRAVLSDFRNRRPYTFKALVVGDMGAYFFWFVLVYSFVTRGADLHPLDTVLSGMGKIIDFAMQLAPK